MDGKLFPEMDPTETARSWFTSAFGVTNSGTVATAPAPGNKLAGSNAAPPLDFDSLRRIIRDYTNRKMAISAQSAISSGMGLNAAMPKMTAKQPLSAAKMQPPQIVPTTGLDAKQLLQQPQGGSGKNIIDQFGPIDMTGGTLDGNHGSGIAKSVAKGSPSSNLSSQIA